MSHTVDPETTTTQRTTALEPQGRRRAAAVTALVIAITLLPFVVSAIALVVSDGAGYHPFNDQAVIEWRLRDIFEQLPLLGPYSRFGWFHPGPLLYFVLAPIYWLTGGSGTGLALAALVVNAAAVVGILLLARRRGGLGLLVLTAVVLSLFLGGLGPAFLRDVWNPFVTVLPFFLLVFLAWTTSCGDRWAIPVSAVVASFIVQSHVGYALPVGVLVAGGLVGILVHERVGRRATDTGTDAAANGSGRPRSLGWIPTIVITAGVLAVTWLPAVVQQVDREPGNLTDLARFFRDHGSEQSVGTAWHVVVTQLGLWPDWLRGTTDLNVIGALDTSSSPVPFVLVALVIATAVAWRTRRRDALALDLLVLALVGSMFAATTRIVGEVYPYLVEWTKVGGAIAWVAIGWTVITALDERAQRAAPDETPSGTWRRVAVAVGIGALAVSSVVATVDAADAGTPLAPDSRRVAAFTDAVERELARTPGDGAVEIRGTGGGNIWMGAGIANLLDERGYDVVVGPELEYVYGSDFVRAPGDRVRLVVEPTELDQGERLEREGGWTQIKRAGYRHLYAKPGPDAR
jgi:hypothetical protein